MLMNVDNQETESMSLLHEEDYSGMRLVVLELKRPYIGVYNVAYVGLSYTPIIEQIEDVECHGGLTYTDGDPIHSVYTPKEFFWVGLDFYHDGDCA